jgi:hypothetical protein
LNEIHAALSECFLGEALMRRMEKG